MPRPERPSSLRELRREQIIEAARALVASGGLDALTIAALEQALPFSRGVISYHFDGKDEIVEAVLRSAVDDIDQATLAAVGLSGPADDQLRAVLRGMVGGYVDHEEAGRILLAFWGQAQHDQRAAAMTRALYARYRAMSRVLLERGRDQGCFAQDVDVDAVSALLVGVVIGTVTQSLLADELDATALAQAAAETLLCGLMAAP